MDKLTIDGWCTPEKGNKMVEIILEKKPQVLVEIGVFGGASLFYCLVGVQKIYNEQLLPPPLSIEMKKKKDEIYNGQMYAIDPWNKSSALEGWKTDNENYVWWSKVNLEDIYLKFIQNLKTLKLESYVTILRQTSSDASKDFKNETIDFIHIDGNHGENALKDVQLWIPKVKKNGIIVFDDVDWPENKPAITELALYTTLIFNHPQWQIYEKI